VTPFFCHFERSEKSPLFIFFVFCKILLREKIMRENFTFKHRKGFTLFELMIVATIIIILSAIAIPNYLHLKYRASEARAYQDLAFMAYLLEIYKIDWGCLPCG